MKTHAELLEVEKGVAEKLGWVNLKIANGVLTGSPSKEIAKLYKPEEVPRWTRNREASFELMVRCNCYAVERTAVYSPDKKPQMIGGHLGGHTVEVSLADFQSREHAAMYVIAQGAMQYLDALNKIKTKV